MLRERGRRVSAVDWSELMAEDTSVADSGDEGEVLHVADRAEQGARRDPIVADGHGTACSFTRSTMIPGADRFLSLLRERELPFLVLTHNSLFTRPRSVRPT